MILGGNWWSANEIVRVHHAHRPDECDDGLTMLSDRPSSSM
jgi:hypothetical protein